MGNNRIGMMKTHDLKTWPEFFEKVATEDKTFEDRGIMQIMDHPVVGPFKMVAWPVRFSGSPPPVKPSPLLGANNEDVLTNWLGLGADQVGGLRTDNIIG